MAGKMRAVTWQTYATLDERRATAEHSECTGVSNAETRGVGRNVNVALLSPLAARRELSGGAGSARAERPTAGARGTAAHHGPFLRSDSIVLVKALAALYDFLTDVRLKTWT